MDKWFASIAGGVLTGLVAGITFSAEAGAREPRISAAAAQQVETLMQEKASRTPAQRRVSSDLLLEIRRQRGEAIVQGLSSVRSSVSSNRFGVLVDIKAEVTDDLLRQIESLGGRVSNAHAGYGTIRARVPLMQLETLAGSPQVRNIRKAWLPIMSKVNTSEGDITHMADLARNDLGVDGTGTKVCVLSDSVDSLAAVQASGDLPGTIDILPGQDGNALPGSIGEGTATLEIIHDLAPGAELGFATAALDEASFAQNILDLRTAGCDVLVDNVLHITEPVFQDGIIAQAVETVVADGAVYFSAAGNFGNLNDGTSGVWEGDFLSTTVPSIPDCPPELGPNCLEGYESAHDFGAGTSLNSIVVDSEIGFILQWSDPQGQSANDYDLYVISGSSVIAYSNNFQTYDGAFPENLFDPFEGIDSRIEDHSGMQLLIVREAGAADRYLHLNAMGGQLAIATEGQTWGHSAAAGAFSVAAVDWGSDTPAPFTGAESVQTYSSDGPRRVFYDAAGAEITPGDVSSTGGTLRQKPDLAAADSVSTATPGFEAFFGTSASAAHAAAIASLMLSRDPSLSSSDLRDIFAETAWDIEAPGVDRDSGMGLVNALDALRKLRDAVVSDFNADANSDILWRNDDGRVVVWQMDGVIKDDSAVIANLATEWVIEDVGDFNEDARADILWRNVTTDSVVVWQMDGYDKQDSSAIGNVGLAWTVEGTGDFNNDGHADILWHNGITGNAIIWLMEGFNQLSAAGIGSVDLDWQVVGIGDFNGDERSDILWHNSVTGSAVVWQMNGTVKEASASVGAPLLAWQVEGVGDFDNDGHADILWRNYSTDGVLIWLMDGFTKVSSGGIGTVPNLVWEVSRLGDFNGSGHDDILWRNVNDGNTVIWQMNEFTREISQSIGTVGLEWTIQ